MKFTVNERLGKETIIFYRILIDFGVSWPYASLTWTSFVIIW